MARSISDADMKRSIQVLIEAKIILMVVEIVSKGSSEGKSGTWSWFFRILKAR